MTERRYAFPVPRRPRVAPEPEPTILGFPAEPDTRPGDQDDVSAGPEQAVRLVVLRRADPIAGGLLVFAGLAANLSLWLPWMAGESATGGTLVRRGLEVVRSGVVEPLRSGLWPGLTVVVSGGVLVVFAMLLFLPAHTHRLVGVLALVTAFAATAGVTTMLAELGWSFARFGPGLWAAVGVAGFGLAGALKAMLTLPLITPVEEERADPA